MLSLRTLLGEACSVTSIFTAGWGSSEVRDFLRLKIRLSGFLRLDRVFVDGAGERVRSSFESDTGAFVVLVFEEAFRSGEGGRKITEADCDE
jgi:hypothetical protein